MDTEVKVQDVYTTGKVARLCEVAPRTVSKWVDSGLLKGWRIPGSFDRRINHADLVAFLRFHGLSHALAKLGERETEVAR